MRIFVSVTDKNWFTQHALRSNVDEVNFWRPSPNATFKALDVGELLLFKLHSPDNFIVGGGFFTKFQQLPVNMVWDAFREANGVSSLSEMRARIGYYRRSPISLSENPIVGCTMLAEPFFWHRDLWIPAPADFKLNTVQGKGYDAETGTGREVWIAVEERLRLLPSEQIAVETATRAAIDSHGFGKPQIMLPRLGQGSFRIIVTDAYERRCALTGERTLPVLEAAQIKPYSVFPRHEVSNGILMRSDLHKLFDEGYITIDPSDRKISVSSRIREEFENGRQPMRSFNKLRYLKFALTSILVLSASAMALAQAPGADSQAYCAYLTEQAQAQSDLLRTPNGLASFTQPNTGLPTQLVAGASLSLSSLKRAGITVDAARKNCDLYKAATGAQQTLQYALPSMEKEALTNRLELIARASKSVDDLIGQTTKMVDAQNMTRPMLLELQMTKIKLEADRADTQSKISAIYVPSLRAQPLKTQVADKQTTDVAEQQALDKLARQNNRDVALTVGAHQQVNPYASGVEPYGEITASYNFSSRAINRHLDRSVDAYADWKSVQESDAARGMEVLRTQMLENITAQQGRLDSLQLESKQIENSLQQAAAPDTSAAFEFRNQLSTTQILLGIEAGDSTFRLDRLKDFLSRNYLQDELNDSGSPHLRG